jgi:alkylation response protein AidB-like acyl-CoA dehydrogenase
VDFTLTPRQEALKARIRAFAAERLARSAIELDRNAAFDRDGWSACAEAGIHGLPIPKALGGEGADPVDMVVALEALGYGCRNQGLLFAINAHIWACEIPILQFGTRTQKEHWLPALCDGTLIGAFATAEPGAGSDAYNLAATATPIDGGYELSGTKMFVTNAPVADVFVVMARLPGTEAGKGIVALIVPRNTPGLSVRTLDKMGLRSAQMGEVTLDRCVVSHDARLGEEGSGVSVLTETMTWERAFILATAVGAMQHQFEDALCYTKHRKQFGTPIGKFQHVSGKLVDMRLRIECARLLLYQLAALKEQGRSLLQEAALTKLYISEAWVASSLDALQIRGGYGYLTETEVERDVRDALGSRLFSGTSEVQRVIVSRCLGL